ncbi:MAG TPA: tRNA threonylcarbamoyladenosine dehydratase [Burkholderiaceae bacterium]|jgi:tRNA A37 threonylcarbamoyladenosine dehydratase|nr:tRNA threonylcarbamoyladenosine dehydratase [Burkholderiaceae bacterium]
MNAAVPAEAVADLERRFGGLRRLYGDAGYERLRAARVAIVGVGGVGSWAAEALARSGVAQLVLVDFDQIAESNVNRQVHALSSTLGAAKVEALRERIAQIHPGCDVVAVEEFVEAPPFGADASHPDSHGHVHVDPHGNWPALLPGLVDAVIDACDQVKAKAVLAAWAQRTRTPFITVGAAGGKQLAQAVEVADLAQVTHDPLLATLRQRMRQRHGAARKGDIGLKCVFSREPVRLPQAADACDVDGTLNCHGYGSVVSVTATFGLVAAGEVMRAIASGEIARTRAQQEA